MSSDADQGRRVRSLVVIGAGLAGAQSVQAARALGWDGHLTVLGAEGLAPYDRPPLSKELFTRTTPAWLRDELGADLAAADDVRLAEPATGLTPRPDGVRVRTSGGAIDADAVVLATGSRPVLPSRWHARTLRTVPDAASLRAAVGPGTRLVVLGAGWIGAEVAGAATAAGAEVTVVEAGRAPLAGALGAEVGSRTIGWYRDAGVRLLTDSPAAAVDEPSRRVRLTDGSVLEADVVLAAVGARPESEWLALSLPVRPDGHLAVDERWQVPGTHGRVAAVGDLARRPSPRHGWVGGGHWDAALRGPALAVRTLLHGPGPVGPVDDPPPYVFSTQLGHDLGLLGRPSPQDEVVLRESPGGWTALWFAPGGAVLTAVLGVDRPRDVSAARKLFAGTDLPRLDRTRAADPEVPLREASLG
ncbi:NAD(P)/FAD-dependent oxidoreductase [Actinotalea sp.]|uniref:NAD(P)/FAD-dependent oxidoreductase n=1 Tax=Actinotalea sp. TaxID=1872145 RepID=UPI00356B133F